MKAWGRFTTTLEQIRQKKDLANIHSNTIILTCGVKTFNWVSVLTQFNFCDVNNLHDNFPSAMLVNRWQNRKNNVSNLPHLSFSHYAVYP